MLNFFRRIRRNLLGEGKVQTYLLYAIGEILLVVIGILIALQIDNLNQIKIDRSSELNSYENIKRQLSEDINVISGNIAYNNRYLEQYKYAVQLIEANDWSKMDTLGGITMNLLKYSDFHRQSNIYESIVNSGEIKLLSNRAITEKLQRLEETYIYINRLEDTHSEAIKLYVVPGIAKSMKLISQEVQKPDMLFDLEFQNNIILLIDLMNEKNEIYDQGINEINAIIELIDEELSLN